MLKTGTVGRARRLPRGLVLSLAMMSTCAAAGSGAAQVSDAGPAPPAGVVEVAAPQPLEISGVAAIPGGYAVVGDDTDDHGRIWPSGARWRIAPEVKGPESVDVGFGPRGEELWLVLGENKRTLSDLGGGTYKFPERYREVCGRGLEGLAVRWDGAAWEVAALWEGGFYKGDCNAPDPFSIPRVAILQWTAGEGTNGPVREFDLKVPRPDDGERFRAPDLVWHGDGLLVLLGSEAEGGGGYDHTWLQGFNLDGEAIGTPLKLEEAWGAFRAGKNWEALDWTLDGTRLVMGFDAKTGRRALAVFPYP